MTREEYVKADRWKRFGYAVSRHPITVFGGYLTVFLYGMTIRSFFLHPKKHFDAGVAVVLHVALLTFCWMQGWDILLLGMLVPLTVACVFSEVDIVAWLLPWLLSRAFSHHSPGARGLSLGLQAGTTAGLWAGTPAGMPRGIFGPVRGFSIA